MSVRRLVAGQGPVVLAAGSAVGAACTDWRHRRQVRALFRVEAAAELAFAVTALATAPGRPRVLDR